MVEVGDKFDDLVVDRDVGGAVQVDPSQLTLRLPSGGLSAFGTKTS